MDNWADKVNVEDGEDVDQMKDYREDEEAASTQPCHLEFVSEGATKVRFQHILPLSSYGRIVRAVVDHMSIVLYAIII